jgi:16S rRNA (adenine1518-N6/adenine1519-N6)-dimethyltransferase
MKDKKVKKNPSKELNLFPHIRLKKRFGQHILMDKDVLEYIVEACELTNDTFVLEIGAGVANLTEGLALHAKKVVAFEIDHQFTIYHKRLLGKYPNVEFLYEDIMDSPWEKMEMKEVQDLVITGNIPYNITSPLVMKILESDIKWRRMVLMLQKELAQRLTAPDGHKNSSGITLKIRSLCSPNLLHIVPRGSFFPPPKVDSAIVSFTPKEGEWKESRIRRAFFQFLDKAFGQRRKILLNSLCHGLGGVITKDDMKDKMMTLGIDPGKRPEAITLEEYKTLFFALMQKNP